MSVPDAALVLALVVTFAILATAHLAIVVGLLARTPRWRGPVAFVLAPLAPYWALRDRMYVRAAAWALGAVAYLVARGLAR